jgi:hypothetical protein
LCQARVHPIFGRQSGEWHSHRSKHERLEIFKIYRCEGIVMRIIKLHDQECGFFHWWPVPIWAKRSDGYAFIIAVFGWAWVIIDRKSKNGGLQ